MADLEKGFILTSDFEERAGKLVLKYYGKTGEKVFCLEFTQEKVVFFVEKSSDLKSIACYSKILEIKEPPLQSLAGISVKALYFDSFFTALDVRKELEAKGIRTYEADVRPHERFLMERFIFGQVEFCGDCMEREGVNFYRNPLIRKTNHYPTLSFASLDIETGVDQTIYSIALDFIDHRNQISSKKVFMRADENKVIDSTTEFVANESLLLQEFVKYFNEIDPDIIIGWHVIGFDLKFMQKRALILNCDLNIGRGRTKFVIDERKGAGFYARIPGRVVLDGPPSMRAAFYSFENFKLETVAQDILGIGKDIASDGGKVEEIERRFKEDKLALAKYNLLDCELVTRIYEKTGLIDLFIKRSIISGLQIDRIGVSTAAFDHFLLPQVHRKGFVAPNTRDIERESASGGGYVVAPAADLYHHIIVLDFKSLYPSIIRTFKIDPYSRVKSDVDTLNNPVGIPFSKTEHILADHIGKLLDQRAIAKDNNDPYLSQAIKILMNSFYGVMGSSRSRFYHAELPDAITRIGQWALKTSIEFFENRNYKVIYGDTDSVFVQITSEESQKVEDIALNLASEVTDFLADLIRIDYKTESFLEMEYEKYYRRFFITKARNGEDGAKKRYVGQSIVAGEPVLDFVGMEYVRSDWTKVAKRFQFELMHKVFEEVEYINWIKDFCKRLEDGEFDSELVYKKRISKNLNEYVKTMPPHIRAAKMINHTGPYRLKDVEYIYTKNGPIPIQLNPSDIDYQHYIEKQIKPLADSVLLVFNMSFDSVVAGHQLNLFEI
ncbi:MAG: DNA polymerase-2 [Thermoproteota archaeon]|jgi:DNA polymerase-2